MIPVLYIIAFRKYQKLQKWIGMKEIALSLMLLFNDKIKTSHYDKWEEFPNLNSFALWFWLNICI